MAEQTGANLAPVKVTALGEDEIRWVSIEATIVIAVINQPTTKRLQSVRQSGFNFGCPQSATFSRIPRVMTPGRQSAALPS
jgi:hypothetical protein